MLQVCWCWGHWSGKARTQWGEGSASPLGSVEAVCTAQRGVRACHAAVHAAKVGESPPLFLLLQLPACIQQGLLHPCSAEAGPVRRVVAWGTVGEGGVPAVHAGVGAQRLCGGPPGAGVAIAAGQGAIPWPSLDRHLLDGVSLLYVVNIFEEV